MRTIIIFILFYAIFMVKAVFGLWERPIARDSNPGTIYFVGLNTESEDSIYGEFTAYQYFSNDTGKTSSKEDFRGASGGTVRLSTDVRNGVLYNYFGGSTNISFDYGETYDYHYDGALLSGGVEGECADFNAWSTNFGESFTHHSASGLPMVFTSFSLGHTSGVIYALSSETNTLFISNDSTETYEPLIPFRYRNSSIRLGANLNEIFIFDRDSIFYSFDGCSTFTERHYFRDQLEVIDSLLWQEPTFIRGWQSREIIGYVIHQYPSQPLGLPSPGGKNSFYFSTGCGASWRKIIEHDVRAIEETHLHEDTTDKLEIVQNSQSIVANEVISLYNIRGKKIAEGEIIPTGKLTKGVYIATNSKNSKKICIF